MVRSVRIFHLLILAALMGVVVGCAGGKQAFPVKGKVLFDGKPMVGGGSITFIPVGSEGGQDAGGMIDEQGNYTVSTVDYGVGALQGKFRVLIVQAAAENPEPTPDGQAPAKVPDPIPQNDRIPTVYADPMNSPLQATVEAKSNEIDFTLERGAVAPNFRQPGA